MKSAIGTIRRIAAGCARLRTLTAGFGRNRRGNVAIIAALTAVPLISAVGCAVDYSYASMIKTKLQAAADAATLATVSNNSPVVTTAKAMTGNGAVSGGSTYAINFFTADTQSFSGVTDSATVSKSSSTVTATLTFSYSVPTFFMKIIPSFNSITVGGSSTASFTLPTYINFYLMLDVSGSMSFPSTPAEQARLMAVNPDNNLGSPGYPQGCQFACHFSRQGACAQTGNPVHQGPIPAVGHSYSGYVPNPSPGGYCQGFTISRLGTTPTSFTSGTTNTQNGGNVNWTNTPVQSCPNAGTTSCIQLQADAVGAGVNALFAQAIAKEAQTGISNEFQIGIFPFIRHLCTSSAGSNNSCSFGLTSTIGSGSSIQTFAANLANLLDTGQDATLGSGGTHFENALPEMNTFITSVGTGTSPSNALPYVFIVTDGSQDYQWQSGGSWGSENWAASANVPYQNSATTIPQNPASPNNRNDQTTGPNATDWCGTMKARGITIAILYIPYQPITNASTIFNNEDGYANINVGYPSGTDYIPASLQSCASPGFFYTATSPAAITSQLQTMFNQVVSTAHIAQ